MPSFKEYHYQRPDIGRLETEWQHLLTGFDRAGSPESQAEIIAAINTLRNDFETMANLVQIRHTANTLDPEYSRENDYLDEIQPFYEGLVNQYYRSLINSPHRPTLEKKWGRQLFRLAELKLRTFTPKVVADLQNENKLTSQYTKLRASARIRFEGEERNLAQMEPFLEAPDRASRKTAQEAYTGFFRKHEAEFDAIYDQLVRLRTDIAHKLDFPSFTGLAYARLGRSDYNPAKVAEYRRQIRETVVPIATRLRQRQAIRLRLPKLKYYDEPLQFVAGNPVPQGDTATLLQNGQQMYRELSLETGQFFRFMVSRELLDLETRPNKGGGGYCTYINNYQAPFIFANCNGTSGDVDVLTHEAGHAFQVYSSRNFTIPEYLWPTLEACEIHSMSMEFFTWPWMKLFFPTEYAKYQYAHLSGALLFLPYGVTVDAFQHWVYEHPEATPAERKKNWRAIEQQYLPHRDYEQNALLNQGGYWLRQGHIFTDPFYYIDYTLAQVCAFQFWIKCQTDRTSAWRDYLRLCQAGGSQSFLELVQLANLENPFTSGCLKAIIGPIGDWLEDAGERL
jgi:M3 family oligoendopeptidase